MHRTRSNMAALMIGVPVILVGMVIAATPSLAQTAQRAESVVIRPDQPPAGAPPASSNAKLPDTPFGGSLRVPLKDNGYLNTGPNRRSSNVIIRRPNRLSPNEAWNLEPVLYLPIAT